MNLLSIVGRKPPRKRRPGPARRGPIRDPRYLAWIRTQWCVLSGEKAFGKFACEEQFPTEAAHVGERGLGQKCSDREVIPLCTGHHRVRSDSHHHLGKRFWAHHGLDRDELIRTYQDNYALECASFSTEF